MTREPAWIGYLQGHSIPWRGDKRETLMRKIDRVTLRGQAIVENRRTGEQWIRNRGSWFKNAEPKGRGGEAA